MTVFAWTWPSIIALICVYLLYPHETEVATSDQTLVHNRNLTWAIVFVVDMSLAPLNLISASFDSLLINACPGNQTATNGTDLVLLFNGKQENDNAQTVKQLLYHNEAWEYTLQEIDELWDGKPLQYKRNDRNHANNGCISKVRIVFCGFNELERKVEIDGTKSGDILLNYCFYTHHDLTDHYDYLFLIQPETKVLINPWFHIVSNEINVARKYAHWFVMPRYSRIKNTTEQNDQKEGPIFLSFNPSIIKIQCDKSPFTCPLWFIDYCLEDFSCFPSQLRINDGEGNNTVETRDHGSREVEDKESKQNTSKRPVAVVSICMWAYLVRCSLLQSSWVIKHNIAYKRKYYRYDNVTACTNKWRLSPHFMFNGKPIGFRKDERVERLESVHIPNEVVFFHSSDTIKEWNLVKRKSMF